jgi:hypothetical protein
MQDYDYPGVGDNIAEVHEVPALHHQNGPFLSYDDRDVTIPLFCKAFWAEVQRWFALTSSLMAQWIELDVEGAWAQT